jgi:cytochrome b subunit of formate dehydrogenase
MNRLLLALVLATTLPQASLAAHSQELGDPRIVAPSIDPESSCKICHEDVLLLRQAVDENDPHADVECVECHLGRRFNPHLPPDLSAAEADLTERFGGYSERSPSIIAGCTSCHDDVTDVWQESIHGSGPKTDAGLHRAGCVSCHGSLHAGTISPANKQAMNDRCIACHQFKDGQTKPAALHVADTYRDTIHGKMIALGNDKAAACYDCHGAHDIHAVDDPRATVNPVNRAQTCRKCHPGATRSFTAAISHRRHTIDSDFWAWATALGFSVLTVGTLLMLFFHLALDLFHATRNALFNGETPEHGPQDAPLAADDEVQRFDWHTRIQHMLMILSFVTLALTGWPLKSAAVGVSSRLVKALGGQATLAVLHRSAGALLIFVSIYHVIYLFVRWRRGKLSLEMTPRLKDLSDLGGNLLYYLGLRRQRPKFGKFTYYEKFDYWAIFWGVPIMAGTGLILWFPEIAARVLPGGLITLAFIAHSDEALLAVLAIFLWHFYNQHLRPAVFPMSWVWITGRISGEALYDEHRLTYEHEYGDTPPRAPAHEANWLEHPGWSIAALAIVFLASVAVLSLDVASLRGQMAKLGISQEPEMQAGLATAASHTIGAYDGRFDPWQTCFSCHNEKRFEDASDSFPHALHFQEEELDADCAGCHDSVFHEHMITHKEGCLECHEPDEIGMPARRPEA